VAGAGLKQLTHHFPPDTDKTAGRTFQGKGHAARVQTVHYRLYDWTGSLLGNRAKCLRAGGEQVVLRREDAGHKLGSVAGVETP